MFSVIVNGTVALVSDFGRCSKMGAMYRSQGHKVLVKKATRADWRQYQRNVAEQEAPLAEVFATAGRLIFNDLDNGMVHLCAMKGEDLVRAQEITRDTAIHIWVKAKNAGLTPERNIPIYP